MFVSKLKFFKSDVEAEWPKSGLERKRTRNLNLNKEIEGLALNKARRKRGCLPKLTKKTISIIFYKLS